MLKNDCAGHRFLALGGLFGKAVMRKIFIEKKARKELNIIYDFYKC